MLLFLVLILSPIKVFSSTAPPSPPSDNNTSDNGNNNNGDDDFSANSVLVRASNGHRVYEIINGKKHWIPTAEMFRARNFNWNNVQVVSGSQLASYSRIKLLRATGDKKVYYLTESGMVRHIPTAQIFESYGNSWNDIWEVTPDELNGYESSTLIKTDGVSKVYILENGTKRWIQTAEIFNARGYDWDKIAPVNILEMNHYPTGNILN